jgi:di/tricarboxylate transporter
MMWQQAIAVAIIAAMMGAFIWGRFRYDLVAALALLAGLASGIVPLEEAFSGFSDDIVIIVGSALVVSAGVARSGIAEAVIQRYAPDLVSVRGQLLLLVTTVTVLSAFVKNIGALAIMIPIAFQFARRSSVSPSIFLMPMAFGALLGGLMTQIGTSPNVIVSRMRDEMVGTPFTMFDFTPVGAGLAVMGILFLTGFYWLLPARQKAQASLEEAINIKNYMAEAHVTAESTVLGKTVSELLKPAHGEAKVTSILRTRGLRVPPLPDAVLREGDILLLEGDHEALNKVVARGRLRLSEDRPVVRAKEGEEVETIEAVIGESSVLVGLSARRMALYHRFNVNLLALSRQGQRITERLAEVTFQPGDVVLLQGPQQAMPETLRELGLLPLAARPIKFGNAERSLVPLAILAAAMGVTASGLVPVQIAFFAAAVLTIMLRVLPPREVYRAVDGPILVMLAALIPVADSLRRTGVTDLAAGYLAELAMALPGWGALTLIMVAAMAVTPFLNNAATVLVMAPIAAGFATSLGFQPEAFLMAVAIGAGCDFLTPIGHQCNMLVMGPGGYRFMDYPRLGLPLSILVVVTGVPLLMLVWPLN